MEPVFITYKGLQLLSPEPIGNAGIVLNSNFRALGDGLELVSSFGNDIAAVSAAVEAVQASLATKESSSSAAQHYALTTTAHGGIVPTSRTISTTTPLTGGGSLASNLTLAINAASGSAAGTMSSAHFTLVNAATSSSTANALVRRSATGTANFIGMTISNGGGTITMLPGTLKGTLANFDDILTVNNQITIGLEGEPDFAGTVTIDGIVTAQKYVGIASGMISGLGTAAIADVGTGVGNVLVFATSATLPALNGSSLTNLNASNLASGTTTVARGDTGVASFGGTNRLLYTSATSTLSSVTTANSSVLVTDGSGVPSGARLYRPSREPCLLDRRSRTTRAA